MFARPAWTCLVGLAITGCSGGTEPSNLPGPPVLLELVSGDGQIVAPGDTTALPLAVRAVDSAGRAVPEVEITFRIRTGRGSLIPGTDARTLSVQTSSEGIAEARWTPGTLPIVPDSADVDAEVSGLEPIAFFLRISFAAPPVGHSIAAAANFTCRITNPIYCWGTLQDGLPPTLYTGATPVTVDGFGGTMCAAVPHGRYCWGDNSLGQYGDGLTTAYQQPHLIQDGLQFSALAIGGAFGCGIDADASVWCWTREAIDGIGTFPGIATGHPAAIWPGMSRIDAGAGFLCGVSTKRRIQCAGEDTYGQLGSTIGEGGGVSFVDVAAGAYHACGLADDGAAWCWGRNDAGQLGDGSLADRSTRLRAAGGQSFTSLAAGARHTCGVAADGGAWCWGSNAHGQLGNGSFDDSAVPVAVAGSRRFSEIAAGSEHTCGISTDGGTLCWGATDLGQVPTFQFLDPVRIEGYAFDELWTGPGRYCGRAGSETYCWNGPSSPWDPSYFEILQQAAGMERVVSGPTSACGLLPGGVAACWGSNEHGQLGDGSVGGTVTDPVPVTGGQRFEEIGVGLAHACGLALTGRVWCWGSNAGGQLGAGSAEPGGGSPREVAGGTTYTSLAVGAGHACALTTGGTIHCWGGNSLGAVGDGTSESKAMPTAIAVNQTFAAVYAVDYSRTCALTASGEAYCWGSGNEGSLGFRPDQRFNVCGGFLGTCSSVPGRVLTDARFQSLTGSSWSTCGLSTDGRTWCWGTHAWGVRGVYPPEGDLMRATLHPTNLEFESIRAVGFSACGLTAAGSVHCWGDLDEWTAVYDFSRGITVPMRF